jgi:Skp family chaperone for outer membrane proteins
MKCLLLCLALIHASAFAQLDPHEQQGLKDTQEFLKNSKERQEWVDKKGGKAKEVDNKVEALAGSKENKEEIYGIAAQVMEKIANETKGDPEAMQKLLLEAQTNPQAFYNKYFDDKAKARVRGVATDIEQKGVKGPSAK